MYGLGTRETGFALKTGFALETGFALWAHVKPGGLRHRPRQHTRAGLALWTSRTSRVMESESRSSGAIITKLADVLSRPGEHLSEHLSSALELRALKCSLERLSSTAQVIIKFFKVSTLINYYST